MRNIIANIFFSLFVWLIISGSSALAHTDVTPEEAYEMIDTTDNLIIIDVRELSEYCGESGHVPGAYLYPWSSGVFQNSYEDLLMDDEILIVCRSGSRSNLAANFLDSKGYLHVYDMLGGTNSWKDTYGYETADCVDSDDDGFNDDLDNCPEVWNPLQMDSDGDRIGNVCDNCNNDYNPSQTDSDGDGTGNVCDDDCPDLDGLNLVNLADFSILASNWLLTGPGLAGDLDANETVEMDDLIIFSQYWLDPCYEQ